MKTTHVFEYKITQDRVVSELVEQRFKYILERTKLSLEQFVTQRLTRNANKLISSDTLVTGDLLGYAHHRTDEAALAWVPNVLYEDDYFFAVDKPDLMPVVPRSSHYFNSVAFRLWEYFGNENLVPLHRLDIETTGVLLIAKKAAHTSAFHKLFRDHEIQKNYRAFVYGMFPKNTQEISGQIIKDTESRIYSKFKLLESDSPNSFTSVLDVIHHNGFSELVLEPKTGKTNQLRIHLAAVGHPIIGDKKYYFTEEVYLDWLNTKQHHLEKMMLPTQALHAESVRFTHPFLTEDVLIESKINFRESVLKAL